MTDRIDWLDPLAWIAMPEASKRRTAREWPNDVACRLRRVGSIAKVARGKVTNSAIQTACELLDQSFDVRRVIEPGGAFINVRSWKPITTKDASRATKTGAQSKPAFYPGPPGVPA